MQVFLKKITINLIKKSYSIISFSYSTFMLKCKLFLCTRK